MKKKLLYFVLACVLSFTSLTGCGGNSDDSTQAESEADDTLATYMTAVQSVIEKSFSDVEYSYKSDDWTCIENDDGTVSVVTKATTKDSSEKQLINGVFTFNDDSYSCHFLKFGNDILVDDGTVE